MSRIRQNKKWEFIYNGDFHEARDYPKKFLCIYDNLDKIPSEVLKNSVVWLDELHEFSTSSFRPKLRFIINKLFDVCLYIIGLSGTVSKLTFGDEFPLFIKVVEKNQVKRILHDVISVVQNKKKFKDGTIKTTYSTYSPQHFVEDRFEKSTAKYFIVFIENKSILHKLHTVYPNSAIYHSGESDKTIESCIAGKTIVNNGSFPDGKNILFTTSGSVAGWDLEDMENGDCEVVIADIHKNLSSLETIYQAVSRVRGVDEVHVYKMQSPLDTSKIDTAPRFNKKEILNKYDNRVNELQAMKGREFNNTDDGKKLLETNDFSSKGYSSFIVGKWENIQGALIRSYSDFATVAQKIREQYAKKIVGFSEVYREEIVRYQGLAPDNNGKMRIQSQMLKTINEKLYEDDIRNYLDANYENLSDSDIELLDEISIWCHDNDKPMLPFVIEILELLKLYGRNDIVAYYGYTDEKTVQPRTLLSRWKIFKETSILNHKVRSALITWFNKRKCICTREEFIEWVKGHKKLFADSKSYRKILVRKRLDSMLQGLFKVDGKIEDNSKDVKVFLKLPFEVNIKDKVLRDALKHRIKSKASISRTLNRWSR